MNGCLMLFFVINLLYGVIIFLMYGVDCINFGMNRVSVNVFSTSFRIVVGGSDAFVVVSGFISVFNCVYFLYVFLFMYFCSIFKN